MSSNKCALDVVNCGTRDAYYCTREKSRSRRRAFFKTLPHAVQLTRWLSCTRSQARGCASKTVSWLLPFSLTGQPPLLQDAWSF